MATIPPPPPPQRTGNAVVDAYLDQLYRWAYTFWFYQSGNGAGTVSATGEVLQIPGLDGEPGEEGPMGFPGATGSRGLPGLTIPGMDGQDAEDALIIPGPRGPQGMAGLVIPGMDGMDGDDWPMPSPVKAPDSYRLDGVTWTTISDLYSVDTTDYYASSTIVGWSALTAGRRNIFYRKLGKWVFVNFHLEGTSDATTVSFTLPYAARTQFGRFGGALILTYDNSAALAAAGQAWISGGSSTVDCYTDSAAGGWTAANTKIVEGSFWYLTD